MSAAAGAGAYLSPSLVRTPRLSRWLAIEAGGSVAARTGKVELGQGIVTALAQIVADELDVAVDRVRMVPASTDSGPDEGSTSGSRSIQDSGAALRQACAEARSILLQAAAHVLAADVADLRVDDGEIVAPDGGRTSYWELVAPGLLDRDASGEASPKPAEVRRLIGANVPRLDLPDKVAGRACFIQDMALPGQLFGRVVRPPSPAATLDDVDVQAASMPGVLVVVRDGSFLGIVADGEDVAAAAARALHANARWRERASLPDEDDLESYLRSEASESFVALERASAADARTAVRTASATFSRPFLAHASIAPSCGVARWDGDDVSIWTHSQGIFGLRAAVASALDIAESCIAVHHVQSAGCYGHNGADDAAFDAVLLARHTPGRPVHVLWSREDELTWAPFGSAMVVDLSAGLNADGRIVSWRHEVWSHGHTSRPGHAGTPGLLAAAHRAGGDALAPASDPPVNRGAGITRNAVPPYNIPDLHVVGHRLLTAALRCSALRTLGAHANVFAAESFMDELAGIARADPVEYRLAHLQDPRSRAVIEAVARRSGWSEPRSGERTGRGIAFARYKGSSAYCAAVAEVEADRDVRLWRLALAVDVGAAVNPDGVLNQVEGGAIQAASWTLKERVRFDRTRITSFSWETYPILRFTEAPAIEIELIDRPDEPSLGVGEAVLGPTAAAIANAVTNVVGVRVRNLPLSRENVLAAIDQAV